MIADFLKMIFGWLWGTLGDRRKLRLTVHQAYFIGSTTPYFFVNLANLSRSREIEVTHVWFDCSPQVPVIQPNRPLPKRLKPDESWETWIEAGAIPSRLWSEAFTLARARLSNGQTLKSRKNENVPETGTVPGGPIQAQ